MICKSCGAEFNDDSRFCPKCGAAKPDVFSTGEDMPFFASNEPAQSFDSTEQQRRDNSGPPYNPSEFRPRQTVQRPEHTPYRPSSLNSQGTYNPQSGRDAQYRRGSETAQGFGEKNSANQTWHSSEPFQNRKTFDDASIRKFLIGFSVVAAIVIALVVVLVVASDSWRVSGFGV